MHAQDARPALCGQQCGGQAAGQALLHGPAGQPADRTFAREAGQQWALSRGVGEARQQRLISLFRLTFADPQQQRDDLRGKPVYLGLAMNEEQVLRLKPQNLLLNLPLAREV